MNDTSATSAPGASLLPSGIDTLTTVHFVILALLALAVIAMIVAGMRRRHMRDIAAREVEQHAEEAGVATLPDEGEAVVDPPERLVRDEPIAAAAPLDANPAVQAAETMMPMPASAPPVAAGADGTGMPVTQLKGLGPKVAVRLGELGITDVGQIAALSDDEAAALDAELGPFRGRMARDRWVDQARLLAAGDRAGFEAVFGKL